MNSLLKKAARLSFMFVAGLALSGVVEVSAQTPRSTGTPLLQPIVITKSSSGPRVSTPSSSIPTKTIVQKQAPVPAPQPQSQPTPGINGITKTVSVQPLYDIPVIPTAGILVEKAAGQTVMDNASNFAFNPASNVKLITAYAVLKTFGPNYRYPTNVWTDGTIDTATGNLYGNLYVSGRDPSFNYEHGVAIAEALNRLGIRNVNGDLVVTSSFMMNFNSSAARSGATLYNTLNTDGRSAAAVRAWQNYSINSGKTFTVPSVTITGKVYEENVLPTNAKVLFSHESAPLKDILKVTLSYSNNEMAQQLANSIGGTEAVERLNQTEQGIAPEELQLATASGLGYNRVTPKAMMKVLRGLRNELARYRLKLEDVMPVAGIDPGTLANRFKAFNQVGSVVAKTGTLGNTDGGVSTLVGETRCANGDILFFVIFNQKGGVKNYRNYQDTLVTTLQNNCGGAAPLGYNSPGFATRMANTRVNYSAASRSRN
ncbi:MAG TPA: D-alanyl-D-alanine carboxypeptidase [Pyrinomonadaceae bacterium]|jgi:D-alanyl-D-alanine carboxypeptidase/D-alanyl-D-alanine-endopeptidase (penicillin-binding protein 4)|nr:D-alanyl-D-alanine carboxypeptidase [Pyrinomonadaceae bacterium]